MENSNYFIRYLAKGEPKLRIICFPYAGGTAAIYRDWVQNLPENVEVLAVQLPGRSTNIFEPPYPDMATLVDDMQERLGNEINLPYVLFGHSLGSRMAFELLNRFHQEGLPLPKRFIASGSRAPHLHRTMRSPPMLTDAQFIELVRSLNGTPEEVIKNDELMNLYMPMLRADFRISQTYQCRCDSVFPCPLTVFSGDHDRGVSYLDIKGWERYFDGSADVRVIAGEHFFIDKQKTAFLAELRSVIDKVIEVELLAQVLA